MLLKRLMIVLGFAAFVFATIGTSLIVSGAYADPDRKPATENRDNGGPAFKKLGF